MDFVIKKRYLQLKMVIGVALIVVATVFFVIYQFLVYKYYYKASLALRQTPQRNLPVASVPAVIYLEADGAVQNVEIPEYGSIYLSDIRRLFPLDVQKGVADIGKMEDYLVWRRTHPKKPPLVVLSATPVP